MRLLPKVVLLLAGAAALPAYAAISVCDTTSGGAGTLTAEGYTGALDAGCSSVNLQFVNFTATNQTSTSVDTGGGANTPATTGPGNVEFFATGTPGSGNTIGPVIGNLNQASGTDNWVLDGAGTQVHDFTISFVVLLNSSYTPVPTNPLLDWAITSYTVTPTVNIDYPGAANPTGNRVIITTTVCTGVTTLASCNANNSGTITSTMNNINDTASYACSFALIVGTCASNQVTFTNPTATVFVNHVIQIDRNGAANTTVGLTNLANSFGETAVAPEPGTVGLMGAALAGLVALRRRRQ